MLNMEFVKEENVLNVSLEGRLDTNTTPEATQKIEENMENVTELVLDFEKLEYISSAGLRLLLSLQKNMNATEGVMRILHVNETIKEIFDVTGFIDILTVEE